MNTNKGSRFPRPDSKYRPPDYKEELWIIDDHIRSELIENRKKNRMQ
jgi:hypothetical protein